MFGARPSIRFRRTNPGSSIGALRGHEKDVPHKNIPRIKEFQGFYAELKNRIDRLSGETRSGGIPKIAVAYGRVLETCASCHAKFRD